MPLPSRSGRLRLPVLCFIVGPSDIKDGDLDATVAAAVAGGATMVQLRAKELPAGELLDLARRLKTLTRGKAQLIVNDRIDVAIAGEVDGVQIPDAGVPTLVARGLIGKYAVVGRSVHSIESAVQAGREGAEFVLAGTIFKSPSHPSAAPVGVSLIEDIARATPTPIVAVGGITAANINDVIKAGASGVAVISAITGASDPKVATEELAQALKDAWAAQNEVLAASA